MTCANKFASALGLLAAAVLVVGLTHSASAEATSKSSLQNRQGWRSRHFLSRSRAKR